MTRRPPLRGVQVDITSLKRDQQELKEKEAKFRRVFEHAGTRLRHPGRQDLRRERVLPRDDRIHPQPDPLGRRELVGADTSGARTSGARRDARAWKIPPPSGSPSSSISPSASGRRRRKNRAVRAREELLAIVSHDLRNPLAAILMSAALLDRRQPATIALAPRSAAAQALPSSMEMPSHEQVRLRIATWACSDSAPAPIEAAAAEHQERDHDQYDQHGCAHCSSSFWPDDQSAQPTNRAPGVPAGGLGFEGRRHRSLTMDSSARRPSCHARLPRALPRGRRRWPWSCPPRSRERAHPRSSRCRRSPR